MERISSAEQDKKGGTLANEVAEIETGINDKKIRITTILLPILSEKALWVQIQLKN